MTTLVARAAQQLKLALSIHELLPPRVSDIGRRWQARNNRLRRLLHHAVDRSPFYQKKFEGIDIDSCKISDLPILTKAEMMENLDAIFTDRTLRRSEIERFISERENVGVLYNEKYAVCHTSGSQGQPALIVQDADAILTTFATQFARGVKIERRFLPHLQKLIKPARMAIITQKPGFYASSIFFSFLPVAAKRFLKLERLSVFDAPEHLVDRLNAFRPNFVTAYASTLELLAREKLAGHLHLSDCLQQMTNISEPLSETSARQIESAFGVHVSNVYTVAECMALTCGCTATHGSHLNDELAILEVVDSANRPVPDGTAGSKVLLTNLYNLIQPIIRYEIDDIVSLSPMDCSCGILLPLIQSVEGRMKDQLWMVAGGQIHNPFYLFQAAMQHEPNLAEHQILQTGFNTFVLRVAPQYGRTISSTKLRSLVQQTFAAEGLAEVISLDIQIVDRIVQEQSGKVRRARNLFTPPPSGQ